MKLLVDDAGFDNIKEMYDIFPVDGVTTNPSILSKYNENPHVILGKIREFIKDDELHVQVVSTHFEEIMEEAYAINSLLGENTYVKVPVTKEGLKAIKEIDKTKIKITATAIYTPMQAFLAAKAGASYTAPYVNRMDNLGVNGIEAVKVIQDIFDNNNLNTEILAASFKNSYQFLELCRYGIGAVTVSPDVMRNLIKNENVSAAVDVFRFDFEKATAKGCTMANTYGEK